MARRIVRVVLAVAVGAVLVLVPASNNVGHASHQYTGWRYDGLYIRGQTFYHGSLVNHTVPQGRTRACNGSSFRSWYVNNTSLWNAWHGVRIWQEGRGPTWYECEWRGSARIIDRYASYPEIRQQHFYRHVDGWTTDENLRYWW